MQKHLLLSILLFLSIILFSQNTPQPVAKYSFNKGSTKNEAGTSSPKICGASFVDDRFGNPNSAVYLHGNNSSYINLGTDSVLKPTSGSISMWINVELIMLKGPGKWDYNPILITKNHQGDDYYEGYFIGLNYNTFRLNVTTSKDQNNQITLNSTSQLELRKWHHLVMCYNDDYLALYLDNKLEAKLPKNFKSVFLRSDSVVIGNSANKKNERCLCGSIDDIQIFNTVLNPAQIEQLYNEPNPNRFQIFMAYAFRFLALTALIFFIVWLTLFWYKRKVKYEAYKNKLNTRLNELETKAARSQMNPHFMFNSLNTLQGFILDNDMNNAHLYLTKFSKLIRKILESSTSDAIPLTEEITILTNYIGLEGMRFEDSFEHSLINHIQHPEKIYIPFMLVQPFVENAIWHGLATKKGFRELLIEFSNLDDKRLLCIIKDNGVGRQNSQHQKDPLKKKSLALEFIRQRLELIKKSTGINCSFKITDLKNTQNESTGTFVEIILPKMPNL